jgi:predicted phosphodiesterase
VRIVVLGDFHLPQEDLSQAFQAMKDVQEAEPDLVVPLGDFGSHDRIGTIDGLNQAYQCLSVINRPLRPILGNHDLQRETGPGLQAKGTIEQAFREMFQLNSSYGVIEQEEFRFIFITTEYQPEHDCYQIHECYVTKEQFAWLIETLDERPDVPAIIFSHAPPIGCGLRTVPDVHVRATNAFLDQCHEPEKWYTLLQEYPQIVLWFSAHYHVGHDHPDSATHRYGTHFFTTGVHGMATRDGQCHSRVIDIHNNSIQVRTLDHTDRQVRSRPDWEFDGSLGDLMAQKTRALTQEKTLNDSNGLADPSDLSGPNESNGLDVPNESNALGDLADPNVSNDRSGWVLVGTVLVGVHGASLEQVIHVDESRCLVRSDDNYLWEVDLRTLSVMGTLQYKHGGHFHAVVASDDPGHVWIAKASTLSKINLNSPWRFVRELKPTEQDYQEVWSRNLDFPAVGMAHVEAWGPMLWIASDNRLYSWKPEDMTLHEVYSPADPKEISGLAAEHDALWLVMRDGERRSYMPGVSVGQTDRDRNRELLRRYESAAEAFIKLQYDGTKDKSPLFTCAMVQGQDNECIQRVYAVEAPQDENSQSTVTIWETAVAKP